MVVSYNNLWKLMIDKKTNKSELCKTLKISSSTMARMTNEEMVAMSVLEKICAELDCNIGDIVELKLNGILEGKNEDIEAGMCGKCLSGHENDIPCLSEGAAFMSPNQFVSVVKHPYVDYGYEEYQHFLPTENVYPPYSLCTRPFGWLLKSSMHELNVKYNLETDEDSELAWPRGKNWLQFGESQEAVFNYFYKDVVVDESQCLVYAKQVPFIEDAGRVIIGIGHVKNISKIKEHKHTNAGTLRSMLWETHISHSIREDHQDGFLIPYEKVMEYAVEHLEFDVKSVFVFAPDDAFAEFSYATEHVSYDAVIEVLLSCIKSFRIINEILDEDYSNVLQWLDERLNEVWDERGAFPGLDSMLCVIKFPHGILVAKEVYDKIGEQDDIWDTLDSVFENPSKHLSKTLADGIDEFTSKVWAKMPKERKTLFKLLSRFDLSIAQGETLYQENLRLKEDIKFSDADIITNPYILYESTRLKRDELAISVKRIDRAVLPVESIREQYPLEAPTTLKADNDVRRVRALAVYALEQAAELGNTILLVNHLIDKMQDIPLQPECGVTADHIAVIEDEIADVIVAKKNRLICRQLAARKMLVNTENSTKAKQIRILFYWKMYWFLVHRLRLRRGLSAQRMRFLQCLNVKLKKIRLFRCFKNTGI